MLGSLQKGVKRITIKATGIKIWIPDPYNSIGIYYLDDAKNRTDPLYRPFFVYTTFDDENEYQITPDYIIIPDIYFIYVLDLRGQRTYHYGDHGGSLPEGWRIDIPQNYTLAKGSFRKDIVNQKAGSYSKGSDVHHNKTRDACNMAYILKNQISKLKTQNSKVPGSLYERLNKALLMCEEIPIKRRDR